MLELGLDKRECVAWYAFMAPKGTPAEIIQKLNTAINQALGEEAIATRIHDLGASPRIMTPAETLAFIKGFQNGNLTVRTAYTCNHSPL